jgi:NAD(P)-dependent dehydrogenase (short-subunit alcohol dehydrogenase family)
MTVIVTGGSSGLGKAICAALPQQLAPIIDWSLKTGVDVRNRASILKAADRLVAQKIDVLINCAGVNSIDYLPNVEEATWDHVMDTNAKGIFLTTQTLLERLRDGTILNIISNASHVPMTSSLAYGASKAAAAIMTQQLARELGKTHGITVFGISPNKMFGTHMSDYIERRVIELRGWTRSQARKYQLDALPAGAETDPLVLAEFIAFLLSEKRRHVFLQGCILPYGGP